MKIDKRIGTALTAMLSVIIVFVAACSSRYEEQIEPVEDDLSVVQEEIILEENDDEAEDSIIDDEVSSVQDLAGGGLNNRSVYFAHNSVGQNIIDGINALGTGIPVLSDQQIGDMGIAETYMGFNGDPAGKMDAFKGLMDNGGNNAQIAFFKLCYADFNEGTNSDALFDKYVSVMTELEGRYPEVTFVHVTAPLYDHNASWHNNRQHAFNEKMRAKYGDYVFDLADIESVGATGNRALAHDGVSPAMADDWSSDGGHLNEAGGKHIAAELISFLCGIALRA